MVCPKCGDDMYHEYDTRHGINVLFCFKCGKRVYEGYPRRYGTRGQDRWEKELKLDGLLRQFGDGSESGVRPQSPP
jgi:hypothetical protein